VEAVSDPRIAEYARLIVERSLDVQPGWQVLIRSNPRAKPLLEEVVRLIARRGAYPILRISTSTLWPGSPEWAAEAPDELVGRMAPIDVFACDQMDARITLTAPENARDGSDLPVEKRTLLRKASQPFYRRSMAMEMPWVGCDFPCPALAQEAGMATDEFEEFLYAAVLRDWDEEARRMERIADRFTAADELRIVGPGTDLTVGLAGRRAIVDDGKYNIPGGEFFFCPLEDSAQGEITFSEFPTERDGTIVTGIRLAFRDGVVVDASASAGQEALLDGLDTDAGSRRLGEVGIGCNEGITRHLNNTLFDEKMAGTVHLALGASYVFAGGTNQSALHWDIVKDLRSGGRLYCDGELVQEDGSWLLSG
jgi:aminopeptidase